MTGPEHYREAERLARIGGQGHADPEEDANVLAEAQVHATLALAAATVAAGAVRMHSGSYKAWNAVTGEA